MKVVAEHNGASINQGTLACVTAASKIGGDVSKFYFLLSM